MLFSKQWTHEMGEAIYGKEYYAALLERRRRIASGEIEVDVWDRLHKRWLKIEAEWEAAESDPAETDDDADRRLKAEAEIVSELIDTRAGCDAEIIEKARVLEKYLCSRLEAPELWQYDERRPPQTG